MGLESDRMMGKAWTWIIPSLGKDCLAPTLPGPSDLAETWAPGGQHLPFFSWPFPPSAPFSPSPSLAPLAHWAVLESVGKGAGFQLNINQAVPVSK